MVEGIIGLRMPKMAIKPEMDDVASAEVEAREAEEFNRQADIDLSAKKSQWARSLQGDHAIGKVPKTEGIQWRHLISEIDFLRQALKNQEEFFLNLLEIDRKKLKVQEITIDLLSGPLKDLAKVSGEVNAFGGANLSRSDSERVVSARRDAIDALRACGFQVSTVQELVDKEWREGPEFKLSADESAMLKRVMARARV